MALFMGLSGCVPDEPLPFVPAYVTPDLRGPLDVGVRTAVVVDPRGGELTIEIWYPSLPYGEVVDYGLPYALESAALRDAPALVGARPLLLFSHGHAGSRLQSIFLTEHLASHGFVVLAVDHPHDTLFDLDESKLAEVASRRPDDVKIVTDWALEANDTPSHWLQGRIREERIGVVGHSFGAWTSLVLGGGVLDLEAGLAYCEQQSPAGCGIVGDIASPDQPPEPDPRVSITIVMAPGGWYSFGSLEGVGPSLVISGREDEDLPFDEEQRPTYERLGDPKSLLVLEHAGHFGFTDACALVPLADCSGAAEGWMEPERVQALTNTAVAAFAGVHLQGESRHEDWLEPSAWSGDAVFTGP